MVPGGNPLFIKKFHHPGVGWAAGICQNPGRFNGDPLKTALGLDGVSSPVIGFAAIGLSLFGFVAGSLSEMRAAPKQEAGR